MTGTRSGAAAAHPAARYATRLVLDLADVPALGPISLCTLAAACHIGGDHQVAVFLDHSSADIAELLTAARLQQEIRSSPPTRLRDRSGPFAFWCAG
jgi:hypothetical protein